ncbi:hypothetical protein [Enterobacter roggenkampii]|uniref:hypothetical protein n=1 Tax=Enterobacter roggenkampii TaxID=1812935 RepID=UPI002075E9CD|nr:hypothetical protein [Enterobacter roggenkampii]MCM7083349.1 hypothetical protein [Enterobacter roggenkampii]
MTKSTRPAWTEDLEPLPAEQRRTGRAGLSNPEKQKRPVPPQFANHVFKKGRKRTGGREARADVWSMLTRAAEIATQRAQQGHHDAMPCDTADELVASLIERVRRTDPEKALRVMAPLIYPKATYKPLKIEVDFNDLEGTLERIAAEMANGGDVSSLNALFNTVKTVQDARALALEMRLSEKELGE